MTDSKPRCQSCGMPLDEAFGNLGTERDGSTTTEYCKLCFREGEFTMPDLTVDEMIQMSIENMTGELGMPLDQATELATTTIPALDRWRADSTA